MFPPPIAFLNDELKAELGMKSNVNTSGKDGAQILHPPWEMIHLPGGDNTVGR
jgi:hypothetical protein